MRVSEVQNDNLPMLSPMFSLTVECKRGTQHRLHSRYVQLRESKHEGGMSKIEQKSVHK
jgi:hypothetical protein